MSSLFGSCVAAETFASATFSFFFLFFFILFVIETVCLHCCLVAFRKPSSSTSWCIKMLSFSLGCYLYIFFLRTRTALLRLLERRLDDLLPYWDQVFSSTLSLLSPSGDCSFLLLLFFLLYGCVFVPRDLLAASCCFAAS